MINKLIPKNSFGGVSTIIGTPTMFTSTTPNCGIDWIVGVNYVIGNPNPAEYKVSIYDAGGGTLIADDVGMGGFWDGYDTGITGDPLDPSFDSTMQFTIRIIRRSDSVIMSSKLSDIIHQQHGPAC